MGIRMVGIYGTQLDGGNGPGRWSKWRPTLSLFQHEDLLVDRLDLLCQDPEQAKTLLDDIRSTSPQTEVVAHAFPLKNPWDFEEVYEGLHGFCNTLAVDDDDELWVHITTGTHVAQICLFLLTESNFLPGKLLQTAPPRRGSKTGSYDLIDLDLARYDSIASRFEQQRTEATAFLKAGIETKNRAFNTLIDQIEQVAIASKAPMLLTGPTGAGKSQLARRIYQLKQRRKQLTGPMMEVNCATLRGDSAMSALFGHKRGAFTGAVADRPGLLLAADRGLLFLDEVGELGLDEQAMLLRAIEDKRFLPVGSEREVRSDFQLIAGTNRDLRARVAEGRFREDLLARIDLWHFDLPGLAERREDIVPNLEYELEQFARKEGRRVSFNREARGQFTKFATSHEATWRANFRDLNAAVTRMSTLAPGGRIASEQVQQEITRLRTAWRVAQAPDGLEQILSAEELAALDRFDRVQLADVVRVCQQHKSLSAAGRALFAVSRTKRKSINDSDRLRKYLAKFDLSWERIGKQA